MLSFFLNAPCVYVGGPLSVPSVVHSMGVFRLLKYYSLVHCFCYFISLWILCTVYTFEANLTNHERAVVHEVCRKMGMTSKSSG